MSSARLLIVLLASPLLAQSSPPVPLEEYRSRRAVLRKSLDDSVLVLFGALEEEQRDQRDGFFQEPNFYYLTGWSEPGAALLMDGSREIIFLPRRNPRVELYSGKKLAPEDANAAAITGVDAVMPLAAFESQVLSFAASAGRISTLRSSPQARKLDALLPMRSVSDAAPLITPMRMKKSPAEIAAIQRAVDATIEAHLAAWRRIRPGLFEYQVSSTMVSAYSERGCQRNAYPPIVGSGPNATILHYFQSSRRMDSGELLLMDVGAECAAYAADLTRTVPVNGRFTPRQREIYEVVLGAQQAVIAAIKPGMIISQNQPNSLHKIALDYMNSHGKDLKGEPLGKYFPHGLGHHIGLNVHDPGAPNAPLAEGHVITVEPGIYIPEEGIGVRIEDVVLVTKDGAKVLSAALPREAAEIERALRGVIGIVPH